MWKRDGYHKDHKEHYDDEHHQDDEDHKDHHHMMKHEYQHTGRKKHSKHHHETEKRHQNHKSEEHHGDEEERDDGYHGDEKERNGGYHGYHEDEMCLEEENEEGHNQDYWRGFYAGVMKQYHWWKYHSGWWGAHDDHHGNKHGDHHGDNHKDHHGNRHDDHHGDKHDDHHGDNHDDHHGDNYDIHHGDKHDDHHTDETHHHGDTSQQHHGNHGEKLTRFQERVKNTRGYRECPWLRRSHPLHTSKGHHLTSLNHMCSGEVECPNFGIMASKGCGYQVRYTPALAWIGTDYTHVDDMLPSNRDALKRLDEFRSSTGLPRTLPVIEILWMEEGMGVVAAQTYIPLPSTHTTLPDPLPEGIYTLHTDPMITLSRAFVHDGVVIEGYERELRDLEGVVERAGHEYRRDMVVLATYGEDGSTARRQEVILVAQL
eukprot:sb/3464923/